ncbi:MAG: hypothetical protein WD276_00980 [Actinomycetota bacterium]
MEYLDAVVAVLREEGGDLHWTVIQDLALKRGYLDPFVQKDIRRNLLSALAAAEREGLVVKKEKGVFGLASGGTGGR